MSLVNVKDIYIQAILSLWHIKEEQFVFFF